MSSIMEKLKDRRNRESIYCTPQYWDSKAEMHDDHSVSMWPNNHLNIYYHSEVLKNIKRFLPAVKGLEVLDVGCGTGRLSRYYTDMEAKVLGFDFSEKSVTIARSLSKKDNPSYRVQSLLDLSVKGAFDVISSWGTITIACRNRQELLLAMNRLHAALKPGGRMLLMEPVHKGFLHRVLNMDLPEFCTVMEEAGFKVKEIRHMHFWPCRLLLAYIPWPNFITAPIYYLGQGIMRLMNYQAFGDYKAVYAVIDRSVQKGNERK